MKKLIASLCAVMACSFLFTATPVQAKTTNYEMTLTKNYQRIWSNGTNKIYITTSKDYTKQKLYLKNVKSGKKKVLKTFTLNQENDESYNIGNVYDYIQLYTDRYLSISTVYLQDYIQGIGEG